MEYFLFVFINVLTLYLLVEILIPAFRVYRDAKHHGIYIHLCGDHGYIFLEKNGKYSVASLNSRVTHSPLFIGDAIYNGYFDAKSKFYGNKVSNID